MNSFGMQGHFSLKGKKSSEICISMVYSAVEPGRFHAEGIRGIQLLAGKQTQMLLPQGAGAVPERRTNHSAPCPI